MNPFCLVRCGCCRSLERFGQLNFQAVAMILASVINAGGMGQADSHPKLDVTTACHGAGHMCGPER